MGDPHSLSARDPRIIGSDLQHCHKAFETDYDGGKMDGFYLEGKGTCPTGVPAKALPYQYVQKSDIKPYWEIAKHWVLADEMFQTQGSGSFTAHQDLIRGDTCIEACSSASSKTKSLVDNPTYWPWGCDAHKSVNTNTINVDGQVYPGGGPFPCTNNFKIKSAGYATLRDSLDAAGVSWKYYTPCFSGSKQPGCTPSSDCNGGVNTCDGDLLDAFDVIYPVRYGAQWGSNVSWPETNILNDIKNAALPAVSWVIPEDDENDHPGDAHDEGPQWVASVVNAIGESAYWKSTAIIVIWDDWGGFYDNAVPPQYKDVAGGLGFRVPMMVLSPYAIAGSGGKGYISHTPYEFGSILKYIEQNWNLGSLGTTDVRAASISDVFNYGQAPRSVFADRIEALGAVLHQQTPHRAAWRSGVNARRCLRVLRWPAVRSVRNPPVPYMQSAAALRSLAQTGAGKIKHVVYIVQENRSFDDLFQGYPGARHRLERQGFEGSHRRA